MKEADGPVKTPVWRIMNTVGDKEYAYKEVVRTSPFNNGIEPAHAAKK